MADDKGAPSGGGGSTWGAIEIIIVLILAIALLSRISGKPLTPIFDSSNPVSKDEKIGPGAKDKVLACAIQIARPRALESIDDFAILAGTVSNCAYDVGVAPSVTAVIVDAANTPISDVVTINLPYVNIENKMSFAANIALTLQPYNSNGFVIVTTAGLINSPTTTIQARVPIRFK